MNGFGRYGAYFALFSEIGVVLLVTILAGVLGGYWIDGQIGTLPLFSLGGFALGCVVGATGVYRLIARFLAGIE
jgi:ATP synthase protein I